VVNTEIILICS